MSDSPPAAPGWRIRSQLLILVVGALLPLIAFTAWSLYHHHRETQRDVRDNARARAQQLRDAVDNHLHFVEGVLASIVPLAIRDRGAIPQAELEAISRHLPEYAVNIMVVDAGGRIVASRIPYSAEMRQNGVAGRPYFEAALQSTHLVVSDPIVGRINGAKLVVCALAFRDSRGHPLGVILLTTHLAAFEARLFEGAADARGGAALLTAAGETVVASRDAPTPAMLRQVFADNPAGERTGTLHLGAGRETTYAAVGTVRAPLVAVVTGDSEGSDVWNMYYGMLGAATFALFLAVGAALWLSGRITKPFGALRDAADRLGAGDLRHRVLGLRGEAGKVAHAFNSMAEQLDAQRIRMRADADRFRAVFHGSPLPMVISDLDSGAVVEVNGAFSALTGHDASAAIGRSTAQLNMWIDPGQRDTAIGLLRDKGRIESFECRHRVRAGREADLLMYGELVQIGGRRMIVSQSVDVTERKHAERYVKQISKRLTLATRSARIGIWDLTLRTRQLVWDDCMFSLFGLEPRDFGGRFEDWLGRVVTADRAEVERCRAEPFAESGELDFQYRIVRPDGAVRHIRSSASVERDEDGRPVRLMGTSRDVTETVLGREALARLNTELEARVVERTGALQETVRELEAFSYTVAHDLRAPLRAIDGFSSCLGQSLEAPERSPDAPQLLAKIRRNVGSMDRLIDGLLNYARLGRQTFRRVPVDMTDLARQVHGELAEAYPGVQITIDALPDAMGDPEMLRQVWTNLIGNACKFSSRQTSPRVAVGANTDEKGTVYFVWDNGVGFDMRYSDRLFRVFERLHGDATYGGAGVGLAVVQRVIQRHAGSVWAEGFPGEGATFHFRLGE
jgi:PAS domain S-box-containing protein